MPKHRKNRRAESFTPTALRPRVERAMREGRFQQALELAKQLHKYEPGPAHLELLRQSYLGRARQLRGQGYNRDAITVLRAALAVDRTTPSWLEQIAGELAQSGEVKESLELAAQLADPAVVARIAARAADAAIPQGVVGRAALPPALHADFDRIVLAFQQVETGQDDAARATVQEIGLRSPFLEWKLLLRGLQAYYQKDDARALENWQRLAPDRVPARLAAPFRWQNDPTFRTAQSPETQGLLQGQLDQVQGSPLLQQLRRVRAALTETDNLAPAFRQAEALLPTLRREAPDLEPRLAACFYWATIETGPDDVTRCQRVFGRPADDPNYSRLHALAHEKAEQFEKAHTFWQKYEKEIADDPARWPAGQADRARALIWMRMGNNARSIPDDEQAARLPAYLRDLPERPRPLKPTAEQCYQRSLDLAPDLLEAHEALFRLHRTGDRAGKAEKAGRRLLERFPDHVPTLEGMSEVLLEKEKPAEALALLQRAMKVNPLNRELRGRVVAAHLQLARAHAEADRFDEARQEYQAALAMEDEPHRWLILCRQAACEFRARQADRAEELLREAQSRSDSSLAVSYQMLVEAIRLKLHRTLKKRFDDEFKAGLATPPTAAGVAAMLRLTASLDHHGVHYFGQKTHAKKVIAYAEKALKADFTEKQLEDVCWTLSSLKAQRAVRRFAAVGQKKFPANPYFPYLEALTYFGSDPSRIEAYRVKPLLEKADKLARALPPDDKQEKLIRDIQARLKVIAAFHPFAMGFMPDVFGRIFDDWDDEEEDEEDDGW